MADSPIKGAEAPVGSVAALRVRPVPPTAVTKIEFTPKKADELRENISVTIEVRGFEKLAPPKRAFLTWLVDNEAKKVTHVEGTTPEVAPLPFRLEVELEPLGESNTSFRIWQSNPSGKGRHPPVLNSVAHELLGWGKVGIRVELDFPHSEPLEIAPKNGIQFNNRIEITPRGHERHDLRIGSPVAFVIDLDAGTELGRHIADGKVWLRFGIEESDDAWASESERAEGSTDAETNDAKDLFAEINLMREMLPEGELTWKVGSAFIDLEGDSVAQLAFAEKAEAGNNYEFAYSIFWALPPKDIKEEPKWRRVLGPQLFAVVPRLKLEQFHLVLNDRWWVHTDDDAAPSLASKAIGQTDDEPGQPRLEVALEISGLDPNMPLPLILRLWQQPKTKRGRTVCIATRRITYGGPDPDDLFVHEFTPRVASEGQFITDADPVARVILEQEAASRQVADRKPKPAPTSLFATLELDPVAIGRAKRPLASVLRFSELFDAFDVKKARNAVAKEAKNATGVVASPVQPSEWTAWAKVLGEAQALDKTETVIVAGPELFEDHFGNKMRFLAHAVRELRVNHRADRHVAVLVFEQEYNEAEVDAFKSAARRFNPRVGIHMISSKDELIRYINTGTTRPGGRPRTDASRTFGPLCVNRLKIFAHGVPGAITFGLDLEYRYDARAHVGVEDSRFCPDGLALRIEDVPLLDKNAFARSALIESFACRTGNGGPCDLTELKGLHWKRATAPTESLAQKLADHTGVEVHAYLVKTEYARTYDTQGEIAAGKYESAHVFLQDENVLLWKKDIPRVAADVVAPRVRKAIVGSIPGIKDPLANHENEVIWNPYGANNPVTGGDTPAGAPRQCFRFRANTEPERLA